VKIRRQREITVGTTTVRVGEPSATQVRRNVAQSTKALGDLVRAIARLPGVKLSPEHGTRIPLYRADPDRPGGLIRKLNGVEERGVIKNGKFKVRT